MIQFRLLIHPFLKRGSLDWALVTNCIFNVNDLKLFLKYILGKRGQDLCLLSFFEFF